jgi:hypothetical protein
MVTDNQLETTLKERARKKILLLKLAAKKQRQLRKKIKENYW